MTGTLEYNAKKGAFYFRNPSIVGLEVDHVEKKYMPKIKEIAELAMTKALSSYPVYTFKEDDVKHKLAKSTLKSVIVKDEALLVTLSLF